MKTEVEGDHIVLLSGRRLYANCGIVGLRPGETLKIHEGYDGMICSEYEQKESDEPLTLPERAEIAEMMIDAWQTYLAAVRAEAE